MKAMELWAYSDYRVVHHTEVQTFVLGEFSTKWHFTRVSEIRRRGDNWAIDIADESTDLKQVHELQSLGFAFIDDKLIKYMKDPYDPTAAPEVTVVADNGQSNAFRIGSQGATCIFEGFLPTVGTPIREIFDRVESTTAVHDSIGVPGVETIRIEGRQSGMTVSMWVDPEFEYQTRKFQFSLSKRDGYLGHFPSTGGVPVASDAEVVAYDLVASDFIFQVIDDVHIPVSVKIRDRWVYSNGMMEIQQHYGRRLSVKLDPEPFDSQRIPRDITESCG